MKKINVSEKAHFAIKDFQLRIRLTALFLIGVLLIPGVFLNPTVFTTKAQTNQPMQELPPTSEPPIPFQISNFGENDSNFAQVNSFNTLTKYFTAPELPEGFESAQTSSPFSQDISAFGASVYSIFTTKVSASQPSGSVEFDFDGDDKADVSRYRGSVTDWQIKQSSDGNTTNLSIGSVGSVIVPGDFDGDGKTDRAVFNAGTWTIKKSSDGITQTISFGTSGDKPVTGDYDGDGKSDAAVFRASTNTWWVLRSIDGNYTSTSFGASGDITAQGNYDGDNKTDIAIFRPSTGDWHISGSSAGYYTLHWGIASDIPTPADFDADGKTDAAVYRGSTGTWYVYKSSTNNGEYITQTWGNYGDQPVPADYDGDSKADFAVFRPTTGVWHIIKSSNSSYDYQTLGIAGDVAVSSAYLKQIGGTVLGYDLAKQRVSPKNATGGTNLYSQNFSWGTGLVGLSGRAGMDAGFGISYNSLIWTKNPTNNTIVFDVDNSNISPGFRFGFPTIEPTYYNSQRKKFSYLMVTPSGGRTEFNQIGASDTYETNDSGYTQLKTIGASDPNTPIENISILVTTTDGTQMSYEWKAGAFRCSQIKDRNGNYISINHDAQGVLRTVTDTLGRIITVNYDSQLYPTSITQTWKNNNGEGSDITHTYASFTYTTAMIDTDFSNLAVIGPADGTSLKVLEKITFANGAAVKFHYQNNKYGQVYKIENIAADSHVLSYLRTNLETPASSQTDCPRFTETYSKTENFNLDSNNQPQEIVINNSITANQPYNIGGHSGTATKIEVSMTGDPYGAVTRSYVGSSGWQEGLPIATEDLVMETTLTQKRWTWTNYTQDDTSKSYILNPRVTQSKIGDSGSTKRTEIDYLMQSGSVSQYGLVSEVRLFDHNNNTLQKKSTTAYNLNTDYVSRRIIGLPSMVEDWGFNQGTTALEYVSKATFNYDGGDFNDSNLEQNISTVIQHDNANYGSSFITGRGNLTSQTRHDVTGQTANVTSTIKYNITGAPVAQIDPLGRTIKVSYTDVFNDTPSNRNTFAYPTKLTDPAGNFSEVKYRYDIGANVWAKSPAPIGSTIGKVTTRTFDLFGRMERESIWKNGQEYSYMRYVYPTNQIQSLVYSTIVDTNNNGVGDTADEVVSETWMDGAGRVRRSRTINPSNPNNWTGNKVEYDIFGQVRRSTIPTEIDANWNPTGDDYRGMIGNEYAWLWNSQEYDWKGRVTRSIPSDSNGTDGKDQIISYDGCGCAGGQTTTIQGPSVPRDDEPNTNARRTQKLYQDILGRTYKTENLKWNGSVYSSSLTTFNGRDQATFIRTFKGIAVLTNEHQDTTFTYDGHGRLKTRHDPKQQDAGTVTSFNYFSDDNIQNVTDGRGVINSYTYNNRGLVETISSTVPANSDILNSGNISFTYDNKGNPSTMTDKMGTLTYQYDELSRLTMESRHFFGDNVGSDLQQAPGGIGIFNISYDYDLGGGLKTITDPYGQSISYTQNKLGQTESVTGSWFAGGNHNYALNVKYRAWGAIKSVDYLNNGGTTRENYTYNNKLLPESYSLYHFSNGNTSIQKQYQYYTDGSLKYIKDGPVSGTGTKFDRSYKYDQIGRLIDGRTGAEARGGDMPSGEERPYFFQRNYDVWSNATSTTQQYWSAETPSPQTQSFINNRVSGFSYDADGRVTLSEGIIYKYDSYGNQHHIENSNNYHQGRWMDGKGNLVREHISDWVVDNDHPNGHFVSRPNVKYYIRSSLMKGDVISESLKDGRKETTYVYGFGKVIGKQSSSFIPFTQPQMISWDYTEPSQSTVKGSNQLQLYPEPVINQSELDPLNVDVGPNVPVETGSGGEPWNYPHHGDSYEGNEGCVVDGVEMSCSLVSEHSSMQCPDNYCGPIVGSNGQFLYLNNQALQMGIGTMSHGPGYLPSNVGFNGSEFSVSGFAFFRIGYDMADHGFDENISIDYLDFASEGMWSNNINSFQESYEGLNQTADQSPRVDISQTDAESAFDRSYDIAKKKLESEKCRKALDGKYNAQEMLNKLKELKKLYIRPDLDPVDSDTQQAVRATAAKTNAFGYGYIIFYNRFFNDKKYFDLGVDDSRALTILHELAHVTRQFDHGGIMGWLPLGSVKQTFETEGEANQYIYDNCFK